MRCQHYTQGGDCPICLKLRIETVIEENKQLKRQLNLLLSKLGQNLLDE